MAVELGTASDHLDLFAKLRAFLKTNAALVAASRQWTELRYNGGTREATLRAPGLAGTDQVHVAMRLIEEPAADRFTIGVQMSRAYNAAQTHLMQPDPSGEMFLPVWNAPMPYWFVANGQRCIVVVKVSTTYQSAHFGKFLPYGSPSEYPQPYYLACTSSQVDRWSVTSQNNRAFFDPGNGARVLTPGGIWVGVSNWFDSNGSPGQQSGGNQVWPFNSFFSQLGPASQAPRERFASMRDNAGVNDYTLLPLVLHGSSPTPEVYGELDGAFAVSGFGNASENEITIGGRVHLVTQDTYRTGRANYAAVLLE